MKKFVILSFLILIGACSSVMLGDSDTDDYGNEWIYTGGRINNCIVNDTVTHLIFPAKLGGNSISAIDASIFKGNTNIVYVDMSATDIKIPSGNIFENCIVLEAVKLPTMLRYISESMFKGCVKLKTINSTELTNLEQIKKSAFHNCSSLENFTIVSNKLTIIEQEAFRGCSSLLRVEIQGVTSPASLKLVQYAFYQCQKLESVYLPSIYEIGKYSFQDCNNFNPDNNTFSKVETIGDYAFQGCTSLAKVVLPKVATIGQQAFVNCSGLKVIDLSTAPIATIAYRTFGSCTSMDTIILSENVTNIESQAFRINGTVASLYFMSNELPNIANDAFYSTTIQKYKVPCECFDNYINASNTPCNANNTVERCDNVIIDADKQLTHSIEADNVSIERNIYNYPRITVGNYSLDAASMDIEWSFDAKHFYYFTLPFDCNINDITIDNQNIANKYITNWSQALSDPDYDNGGWQILKYNEPSYANGNSGQFAYDAVNKNYTIEAGVGYVFALLNPINSSASFSIKATFPNNYGYKFSGNNTTSAPSSFTNSSVGGKSGWNLYGNPYYWDIPISNYGTQAGGWVVKPATSSEAAQVEHRLSSQSLNPSEVVYIQTTNANGITISANPTTTARVPSRYSTQRPIRLNLLHNNKTDDYLYIQNNTEASDSYIIGEDCYKMKNAGKNQIYTMIDGAVETTFNSMNLEGSVHTIPVGLTIENGGTFQISVTEGTNFMPGTILKLRDIQNGAEYNLLNGPATITVGKGTINNRYVIEVMDIPCSEEQISEAVNFTAFVSDGKLVVAGIAANDIVKVYDAMGRMITSLTASADIMNIDLGVRGVYFVNVNSETIKVVY